MSPFWDTFSNLYSKQVTLGKIMQNICIYRQTHIWAFSFLKVLEENKQKKQQKSIRQSAWVSSVVVSSSLLLHSSLLLEVLVQVLGHRPVGAKDLWVIWAGVTKLVLFVSISQVTSQTLQVCWDVKVTILLTHHLGGGGGISKNKQVKDWWRSLLITTDQILTHSTEDENYQQFRIWPNVVTVFPPSQDNLWPFG